MKIPKKVKNLIEKNIIYLTTSNSTQPNLTVTQSGVVLSSDQFLICDCAMALAKENILANPNCCLIVSDQKEELFYKIFGKATYYKNGKYLEIAKKRLTGEPYKAKGAVVIKVDRIFKVE